LQGCTESTALMFNNHKAQTIMYRHLICLWWLRTAFKTCSSKRRTNQSLYPESQVLAKQKPPRLFYATLRKPIQTLKERMSTS